MRITQQWMTFPRTKLAGKIQHVFLMADVMFGNSASEQFFIDTTLLITAGFFILVVGIIIGFYVESLFNSNHWKRKTTKASISYTEEENGNTDSAVLNTIPSKVKNNIVKIYMIFVITHA